MKLPDSFLDELRARTPLAPLIGRTVKLSRSGRQSKGCCPFHGEKTPSFYVYEDGYHCFGCGAHGDAIGFVMQARGATFLEAVETLAGEAGLDMPRPEPSAMAAERARLDLQGVLEAAAAFFAKKLAGPEGAAARTYLASRGITESSIAAFGLGWSGEGRGALAADLAAADITPAQLLEAGLLRQGEDGAPRGDLFFNRLMFPIRDRRGRVISFGGRTLGDGQPKYLNGPETPVFSKRRTLYGLNLAREAVRKGADLVVVEGYMDVIALHQAGFGGAVAPCGTALTAGQLEELWRLADAPVLCFDGDAAGARAAARAADLALPLIAPDRTLCLATLPPGEDPDSLVRQRGPDAFAAVLAGKRPLATALFDLLREGFAADTPEARAALRARLDAAAARIGDKGLASEYRSTLRDRFFAATRRPGGRTTGPARTASHSPRPPAGADAGAERHRALLAILVNHPALIGDVAEALSGLALAPTQRRVRDAILHWHHLHEHDSAEVLDSAALMNHLAQSGYAAEADLLLSSRPMPLPACAGPSSDAGGGRGGMVALLRTAEPSPAGGGGGRRPCRLRTRARPGCAGSSGGTLRRP